MASKFAAIKTKYDKAEHAWRDVEELFERGTMVELYDEAVKARPTVANITAICTIEVRGGLSLRQLDKLHAWAHEMLDDGEPKAIRGDLQAERDLLYELLKAYAERNELQCDGCGTCLECEIVAIVGETP